MAQRRSLQRTASAAGEAETRPGAEARVRLAQGERERQIVEAAAHFFAEVGFEGRTRDLARRMGVTQALIYRYFPTKSALVERVLSAHLGRPWDPAWTDLLADRTRPLKDRVADFYRAYAARFSYVGMRLFVRANMDGRGLAGRKSFDLTDALFRPLIAELRFEAGLSGLDARPMTRGERELAMALHGAVVFAGIRKFVYQMPLPDSVDDLVGLAVEAFFTGAANTVRRLAGLPAGDSLAVPLVGRQRRS